MENKLFKRYWFFTVIGISVAAFYPLLMGVRVVTDMLTKGTVMKEDYPKYIIPYTPIAIAVIIGVLLLPLLIKLLKRFAFLGGGAISIGGFFALELLFEAKVIITGTGRVNLQDWQTYLCMVPPEYYETRDYTAVEILMGEYNPAFKLHFYVISVLLILAVLNCIYGFGQLILSGNKTRLKPLILQSVSAASFLSMCILACFTAFWRDGNLEVSPLSASLMAIFFILMGLTGGIFAGSFLVKKRKLLSVALPATVASALALLMYIGEMILLNKHLYILGKGFFFQNLPFVILSLADISIILLSGVITAVIFGLINRDKKQKIKE